MRDSSRLILALDETDRTKALEVVEHTRDIVDAIKINYPLLLHTGPDIITRISKICPVICDFKIADIPNTNSLIVKRAIELGAQGVICHAFPGSDSVEACVEAADGRDVYVVTEMSHPGGTQYTADHAERFAEVALESGAAGVIAPATRPQTIAQIREIIGDLKILSPGVGAQGGTAYETVMAGADYLIVGRSIYKADNPKTEAEKLVIDIKRALLER